MASAHSLQFAFSTCFQRISGLLTWFLLLTQVDAQNRSSEVDLLLNFKEEMHHAGIYYSLEGNYGEVTNSEGYWSTWKDTNDTPCAWEGVMCNNATSTVEWLDLSGCGLQFLVTNWTFLSGLRNLREVDLSSNGLIGSVDGPENPGDIQTLTQLTLLDLSSNSFQGAISPSISACRNPQYISLQHNQLSSEIPSRDGLVNLQALLVGNQLTSEFAPELGQITSLVTIDLSNNIYAK